MATEDGVPQDQSAFAEEVGKKDTELQSTASGVAVDKLFQVEEKKAETLTKEPHETTGVNSEVEMRKEFMAGNLGLKDGKKFSESPMLFEVSGEKNSSSSQVCKGKDMTKEANMGKTQTNLIMEEDLQFQEVEVTVEEAHSPGKQPNAEKESRDLNREEAGHIIREETTLDLQEATSAQTTGVKDHQPDSTQGINLDAAKLSLTHNQDQDAAQANTFNSSATSLGDLHETGLPTNEEKDSPISTILESEKMEPEGLNSSLIIDDETTVEVESSSDHTRNVPSGTECEKDHTEMAKENSQHVEMLPHSIRVEDELTGKIEYLSDFSRNVYTETECGSSHSEATQRNSQDAEILPHSVTVEHEATKDVASLSEHTGNVSIETGCGRKNGEKTKGNPQVAEELRHSDNMEDETTEEVEISSDVIGNVSIETECETDHTEVIEGISEDAKILPHSFVLEEETTEEVESFSEHVRTVSTETECGSDPNEVTKVNMQDAEILSYSVALEDEKIGKAGSSSALARNVSIETGGSNYIEATREEISENIELLPGNSLTTPSTEGTSTWEAEPGKTNQEVKLTDDRTEEEILESKNVSVSSTVDCPYKHEKEDIENGSLAAQVSSPLVNALTEEMLLKDADSEKVQELEAHSGTMYEKEDHDTEDTSYIEPALVKEVSDMVPMIAQENQCEVENQNKFLEEIVTVKSTESAMDKAEGRPQSSSSDSVMKQEGTLQKESQERVLAELLAVAEKPVGLEIFNTTKDLDDLLPGKENHHESLPAASMPLGKIDLSQHSERATSIEEQRLIECLEGDLSEEKDSTSNASKSKAEDSQQEKEVDSAILNDAVHNTYETGRSPESTILEHLSAVEESSLELTSTTETEGDKHEKNDVINIEDEMQEQDEVPSGKEEKFAPHICTDDEQKLVEDPSAGNSKIECPKEKADYIKDDEEIRGNDSEEAAPELKEDRITVQEVHKDASSRDEERETHIRDKEQVVTENSAESSGAEKNKSNHEDKIEAPNPETDDVPKREAVYSNDDKEIKDSDPDKGVSELKEDQIVAKEAHMDTFSKVKEKEIQTIDKAEVVIEYLVEASVAEENKSDDEVITDAANPEADDVHKVEVLYSKNDEQIKRNDSEEGGQKRKDYQIVAEEAHKDTCSKDKEKETQIMDKEEVDTDYSVESSATEENKSDHEVKTETTNPDADDVHKGEAHHINDDEEIKGNDRKEVAPEPKEDQIVAEEAHKDTFSKDDEKEKEITDKEEVAIEYMVESSAAEENKYDHEVKKEATNPEANDVHKGEAVYGNDHEETKCNDSEKGAPEQKEVQILAEEAHKNNEKETQKIDKEEIATDYLVASFAAEENKSDREVKLEATNPEADDVHKGETDHINDDKEIKGNHPEKVEPDSKDQSAAEEVHKDTFSRNEENEKHIIDKEEVATKYAVESSVAEENKDSHEVMIEETNPEANDIHKGEAVYRNDREETKGNDPEEGAPEQKEDQILAEEATNSEADDLRKGEAEHINDDEDVKGNHPEEVAPEPKEDLIAVDEVHKDTFREDEEEEKQITDQEEVDTECLVESSFAEENKYHHEVKKEATNPEANDVHNREAANNSNDHEDTKGNDSEEAAPELKEVQILAEEAHKEKEKETQIIDKEEAATDYLVECSAAEENKSDREVLEATKPETDCVDRGKADHINDDEEIKGNDLTEVAPEPKDDQIAAEEVHKDTFIKDEEKEKIIDKEEIAMEYLVESSVAEENKYSHEVKTEATNLEANYVHKGEAVYSNDHEETKGDGSEKGAPEPKEDQVVAEEVYEDTFSKDEDKETKIIDKEKVVTECLVESIAEKDKSDHEVKAEATDSEAGDAPKAEADYINTDEEIKANDPEEVAPEPREDEIVAKERVMQVHNDTFSKDEEKETPIMDKKQVVTDYLVESSVAEQKRSDHKVETEATNPKAGEVPSSDENIDAVEGKKAQNEPQESVSEDTIAEDKIATQIPNQEETKEEFGSKHNFATFSTEEMMNEDSCEENKKGELDREKIHQGQDIEEQIDKETGSYNNSYTKSLEEEIAQESFQEDEANKRMVTDTKMNKEESVNLAIPITMDEEKSVEGSLEQEKWDVPKPEKETEDIDIKGTRQNDEATHFAQDGEKETVMHERNADIGGDAVDTIRLAEGLTPSEYQEQAENSSAAPETSEESKEKMLDTIVSTEIRSGEGSLKKEDLDFIKPEKETKDLDMEGKRHNDEVTYSALEEEKEPVKHEGNLDTGTDILREELPPREYQELAENSITVPETSEERNEKMLGTSESTEIIPIEGSLKQEEWDVMEPEKETKALDIERITQNDEATHSAQNGEMEKVKHEGNPDAAGTDRLTEGLPPREGQKLADNSSAMPAISEERSEKMLGTTESTETRSVEGNLKQEEADVTEPEKQTKDLEIEGIAPGDEAIHSAQEGEKDTVKHEGNPDTAGTDTSTKGLPPRECQELAENSNAVPDIAEEMNKKTFDITESTARRSVEGSLKQEEWDVLEPEKDRKDLDIEGTTQNDMTTHSAQEGQNETVKHEGNPDATGIDRSTERLPQREYLELDENSSAVPDISEEMNEKMLGTTESTERRPVEGSLKQEEQDVMESEKETKDLDIEGPTQNDEATHSAQESEKETVNHEGNVDVAGTSRIGEGLPPREYQELAENSSAVPEISEKCKEQMLEPRESTEMRVLEGSLKQEEWDVLEPEKERKDLDIEGTTQNDVTTHSAQEGQNETVKHEGNPDATGIDRSTERLPQREYLELNENSSAVPDISEEMNEKMLGTTESTERRPVEGSLKQEERDVMESEKETKDLDIEGTTQNDEATHSAQESEKETVNHEGNVDVAGTSRIEEGLPPREYQELAENSSAVPEISGKCKEQMLEHRESTEMRVLEGSLKQEEWDVLEPEKDRKDLDIEGTTQNDMTTHSAQEGQNETVKHEGNPDATGIDRSTERLPQREYLELDENSSAVPDISEEMNEKMLGTTESTERRPVEGSLKQEEQDVMESEKETKDLDIEGPTQNDEATHSAQESEKETVNHEGNVDVAGTSRIGEGLPPREYQELAENSSAVPEISEKCKEQMLEPRESTEMRVLEGSLKQEEWDVLEPEKERKDLDIEGTTQNDVTTHSAQEGQNETVKHEGNPDATGIDRSTERLPQREYLELNENSSAVPDISEEMNEKMLGTTESTERRPVEGSLKQEERDVMESEKETKDLDIEGTTQNDEATHSAQESEKETVNHEGNVDVAGTSRIAEGLPPRKYQELAENSSAVPEISEKCKEQMLEPRESTEMRVLEGSLKQEEWDVLEPEKERKDLDIEGTTQNDVTTHSAQDGQNETVKHEGNPDATGIDRSTERLPQREYLELNENSSAVPDISEEMNEKMLGTTESTERRPVEGSLKQEERDVMESEKETKDLDIEGTTQNDEATHSAQESEKETVNHEGNVDVAGTSRIAEGLPPREYQELAENSSAVPEISEKCKEQMLKPRESTEMRLLEESLKQEEQEVMELKETIDSDIDGRTENNEATDSAQECGKEMVKYEGNADAGGTYRLADGLHQELENSSAVPQSSEKVKERMLDTMESTETRSVEGSLKQEEWDVLEPEKERKDMDIEGTTQNDVTTHSAQEGERETIKHAGNADVAGDNAGTIKLEGIPPREYQKVAENSSAVPEDLEKSKEKMLDTESKEIVAKVETKEVKLQENTQLDNNTQALEKVDLVAIESNETEENDMVSIYRYQHVSSLEENEEMKVLAEERSGEDSTRRIPALDGQNNMSTLLRSEDHITTGGTLLHDSLQQNAHDCTVPPLNEQNIVTAEAYKTIDETLEKSEGSSITTEAVLEPAGDIEIQKPTAGEEGFTRDNNSKSSENLSTDKQVLELKAEDQMHHTEDSERNQTSSVTEKSESREQQELKAKGKTDKEQYHDDREMKALSTLEAKQVLMGAERADEHENMTEKIKGGKILVDNFKSSQEETHCESIPGQISKEEHPNQTADGTSLTEVINQDISPSNLAVEASDTRPQLIRDPGVATSDTETATSKTAGDNIQEGKAYSITQEAAEEQKGSEKVANFTDLAHQESEEDIKKDVAVREADTFPDDVKDTPMIRQENDEPRLEEVHGDDSDEKTLKTINTISIEHSSEEVDGAKFQNISAQVLQHQPTVSEHPEKGSCSIAESSDLNANEATDPSQQVPVEKIFQPEIEILESTDASEAVEGAKGGEYLESMKIIDHCQSTAEKFESTTFAESSQFDLQQPKKEPLQQQDAIEAQDQHQNLHASSDINSSASVIGTKGGPFCATTANDVNVPLEMEKLEAVPFSESEKCIPEEADTNNISIDSKNILQMQQNAIEESFQAVGDNLEPSKVKPEEAPHGEEKGTREEATLGSTPRETTATLLSDLLRTSKKEISQVASDSTAETEPNVQKEEMKDVKSEMAEHEEPKSNEEGEGDEGKKQSELMTVQSP